MTKTNNEEKRWPQELFFQECVWCGEKTNIDFVQEKFQEVAEHTRQALLSHLISKVEGMIEKNNFWKKDGERCDLCMEEDHCYHTIQNDSLQEVLALLRE